MSKLVEKFFYPESRPRVQPGTLNTYLNHYSYLIARKAPDIYGDFDNIFFDGIAIASISRLFGIRKPRASFDMTSMAREVFSLCDREGYSLYLIGSQPDVARQAAERFKEKFRDLKIVGYAPGFFPTEADREHMIDEILALNPDFLVCGMGTPHQDLFLVRLRKVGWKGTGYTCGGFLHQTAKGGIDYYPSLLDRLNLRWLYRIYDEPQLIPRYTTHFVRFVWLYTWDMLKYKFKSSP